MYLYKMSCYNESCLTRSTSAKYEKLDTFWKYLIRKKNLKENAWLSLENDAMQNHNKRYLILLQIPDLARIRLTNTGLQDGIWGPFRPLFFLSKKKRKKSNIFENFVSHKIIFFIKKCDLFSEILNDFLAVLKIPCWERVTWWSLWWFFKYQNPLASQLMVFENNGILTVKVSSFPPSNPLVQT